MHVSTAKKQNKFRKFTTAVFLAFAIWAVLFLSARLCAAESRMFQTTRTCQVGDSQSRDDARTLCFLQAKRTLAEQAGSYVQVVTQTRDFQLTRDEITSYSAALMQSEIVDEKLLAANGTLSITMTVRAQVDPDVLLQRLDRIQADVASRDLVRRSVDREGRLEESLAGEPDGKATGPTPVPQGQWPPDGRQAAPAPGRMAMVPDPPTPRIAPRSPEQLQADQRALLRDLGEQTRAAKATVAKGMARAEVQSLLGAPRAGKTNVALGSTWTCEMHGRVWVVYKDGIVRCTRRRLSYSRDYGSDCHCSGMGQDFLLR